MKRLLFLVLIVSACTSPGQNTYDTRELGRSKLVNFGTVIGVRTVQVVDRDSKGAAVGGVVGLVAGRKGSSPGEVVASTLAGAATGAAVGALAQPQDAVEYTVTLETGATLTLAQARNPADRPIAVGDRVMVQLSSGVQRVLPASDLPTSIAKPQGITLTSRN